MSSVAISNAATLRAVFSYLALLTLGIALWHYVHGIPWVFLLVFAAVFVIFAAMAAVVIWRSK